MLSGTSAIIQFSTTGIPALLNFGISYRQIRNLLFVVRSGPNQSELEYKPTRPTKFLLFGTATPILEDQQSFDLI
jgi:hypothetical protein